MVLALPLATACSVLSELSQLRILDLDLLDRRCSSRSKVACLLPKEGNPGGVLTLAGAGWGGSRG